MKAVVIREHGGIQNLLFEDIETPKPGTGEVLVRIRATGVNHFDHDIREGDVIEAYEIDEIARTL